MLRNLTNINRSMTYMNSNMMLFAPSSLRNNWTTNRLEKQQQETQTLVPFTINNLWDNPGARRLRKRVGRGPGSGLGKTSGAGHKGMYARAGGTINRGFEGGQSGLHLRFPKFGF